MRRIKDYSYYPCRSTIDNKVDVILKKLPTVFSAESFIQIVENTIPSLYNLSYKRDQLNKWIAIWYLRIRDDLVVPVKPTILKRLKNGKRVVLKAKGMWRKRRKIYTDSKQTNRDRLVICLSSVPVWVLHLLNQDLLFISCGLSFSLTIMFNP